MNTLFVIVRLHFGSVRMTYKLFIILCLNLNWDGHGKLGLHSLKNIPGLEWYSYRDGSTV